MPLGVHLFQLLMNMQGADATAKYLSATGFNPTWTADKQVDTAKQRAEKYLKYCGRMLVGAMNRTCEKVARLRLLMDLFCGVPKGLRPG
jgi:hypothetical protein